MAKRGNNEGSIRKRKDGRWEARLQVGWKPDGRADIRSRYGKTRKEAAAKLDKLKQEIAQGKVLDGDKVLFSKWTLRAYEIFKKPTVKTSTQEVYEASIKHFKDSVIDVPLKDLTTSSIQTFLNEQAKLYSYETVKRLRTLIGWSIKKAIQERFILYDPFVGTEIPKCNTDGERDVIPLSIEDTKKLLTYAKQNSKKSETMIIALTMLLLKTGLRIGEALALTTDDIKDNHINVDKTLRNTKNQLVVGTAKTKNSVRVVPYPDSLNYYLKLWRITKNEKRLIWAEIWDDRDFYFCTETGRPLDSKNVLRAFRRLLKRAGVEDAKKYGLHSLRHTFATRMWEIGIDPATAAQILGHNISTMLKHYTEVGEKFKVDAINKLDAII